MGNLRWGWMAAVSLVATQLLAQKAALPITFEIPKAWTHLESKDRNGVASHLYQVKDTAPAGSSTIPSNALITLYEAPEGITAKDEDAIVASRMKEATHILTGVDGEAWRTYIYVTYQGKQQLVILYRIGIVGGCVAEAMLCFPHVAEKKNTTFSILTLEESTVPSETLTGIYCNPSSMAEMVEQFNSFCASLKISGANVFLSRVKLVDPPPDARYYRKTEAGGK